MKNKSWQNPNWRNNISVGPMLGTTCQTNHSDGASQSFHLPQLAEEALLIVLEHLITFQAQPQQVSKKAESWKALKDEAV